MGAMSSSRWAILRAPALLIDHFSPLVLKRAALLIRTFTRLSARLQVTKALTPAYRIPQWTNV